MVTINPYLNFSGNAEEAFNFYKSVFGGEFIALQRFKDLPPDVPEMDADENKILHVALRIGEHSILMGSDQPRSMGAVNAGDNFFISVDAPSEEETKRLFHALSEGGTVLMALGKTFWNAYFGMCRDKFNVQWMVSYSYK